MPPRLEDPITINGVTIPNRFYRAPLLECAGNGPDAVQTLIRELQPSAASGVGLIFQGATLVRDEGGRAAPNMTRVHDRDFVQSLQQLTDTIHDHDARIFIQLEEGGLRSMETWHAAYRAKHPHLQQLAASPLPPLLKLLDTLGFLEYDTHVLSTDEIYELAADFGQAAGFAVEAGYDGIHLAGANMGIIQQFLSPFYNRRDDEFGGSFEARVRFLEVLHDKIRARIGPDVPLVTKIPVETAAPWFVRRHLSLSDGIRIAQRLEEIGFDAVVPVQGSVFWDMSLIRGAYPERAWNDARFQNGYEAAFGSRFRARAVAFLNWLQAQTYSFEPAWNSPVISRVKDVVSIPVLAEGGIRSRAQMDHLLGTQTCDLVGMGRPFYAEPRIAARMLAQSDEDIHTACKNCNNCTVPQVTGARGVCRTPSVLQKKGQLETEGAYER